MAKKVVATLKTGKGKEYSKVITMVRSPRTGAYSFKETIAHNDHIRDAIKLAKDQAALAQEQAAAAE